MAKHTRPYACPEIGCDVSPFGGKAGLQRHKREVHRLNDGYDRPAKEYRCPKPGCKRNQRAFSRQSNMREHYRRTHGSHLQIDLAIDRPRAANLGLSSENSAITSAAPSSPRSDQDEGHKSTLREGLRTQIEKLELERAEVDKKLAAVRAVMSDL
jgi:hypothetical protein